MKHSILFLLILISKSGIEGKPSYQKITINLMGKTDPIKYTIKDNRITVKFKNEGSGKWIYTQDIYTRSRQVKGGVIYTFSLSAGIRIRRGSNLIAYASASLHDGGTLYEEWKIETTEKISNIHSSIRLFKLKGIKGKSKTGTERISAEKKEILLSVYGRTPHISESLIDKSFTIRIKERNSKKWLFRKRIRPVTISDSTGTIYTVHSEERLKLTKGRPVQIEIFATLEDGREIFGNFYSNLTFPEKKLNISMGINSYRGIKQARETADLLNPDEIILEGWINLPAMMIHRLNKSNDSLPSGFNATLVIKDSSGNQLISVKIPMKPYKRGSYRGILTGAIQIRLEIERIKGVFFILSRKGRQLYTDDIPLNILPDKNGKKITIKESLEKIK